MEWRCKLGAVETIFEEDSEELHESPSSTISCSPPLSSPSTPDDLRSSVEAWSLATRRKPDVKIHVQGVCFTLHKDTLTTKSAYLKRHLKIDGSRSSSELTLSPPLKVTPDAFKLVAEFCYGCDVVLSSSTLASLRTAVDLLEMSTAAGHDRDGEDLRQKAESYFSFTVAPDRELSAIVFRSCLKLLPEAEEVAFLPSRCLEALCTYDDDDGGIRCSDCLKEVRPEDFLTIADSMQRRLSRSHDFLYRIVDAYLKVYDGKMSDDHKTRICNCIDCSMLSPRLLIQAVQNPRMPLRFVVQAMLMDQLNTRRSIFSAINSSSIQADIRHDRCSSSSSQPQPRSQQEEEEGDNSLGTTDTQPATLGALLQRDAALRQVAHLKAAIDNTTSRIHTLENELSVMKLRLIESELQRNSNAVTGDAGDSSSARSVSDRFTTKGAALNKVERGERGSVSSGHVQFRAQKQTNGGHSEKSVSETTPHGKNSIGQWLVNGLKNAFRVSNSTSKRASSKLIMAYPPSSSEERGKGGGMMEGYDGAIAELHAAAAAASAGGAEPHISNSSHRRSQSLG